MKLLYTILDSAGPTTYHRSRAAAALDLIDRLGADRPRSLTGSEIVAALTRSSRVWILTESGREVSVDWTEVAK
jgi:hypothetical protein